jgi:hypothetical protein
VAVPGLPCLQERERLERVPGERVSAVALEPQLDVRVVVDVLAAALLAGAGEHDLRPPERELAGDLLLERLEAVAVDLQR